MGQQQPGYRIPYTMMREREGVAAVSPPPQPTHRAPGLPPAYRSYSHPRTMLVEAAGGKVDLTPHPTKPDVWSIVATNGKIPIDEIL